MTHQCASVLMQNFSYCSSLQSTCRPDLGQAWVRGVLIAYKPLSGENHPISAELRGRYPFRDTIALTQECHRERDGTDTQQFSADPNQTMRQEPITQKAGTLACSCLFCPEISEMQSLLDIKFSCRFRAWGYQ